MRLILIGLFLVFNFQGYSQKYISSKSKISFFSSAPLEDIEANNEKARSAFDAANGKIVFSVPINEFQFKKSLMQEHFNEKYLESEKYPKATFSGTVKNFEPGQDNKNAIAEGEFEIHGVSQKVSIPGQLDLRDNRAIIESKFIIKLEDYKIKIPSLMFRNIAEEVEVTVSFEYTIHEN